MLEMEDQGRQGGSRKKNVAKDLDHEIAPDQLKSMTIADQYNWVK